MSINFQELRDLLTAIANTDVTELNLKNADFELSVKKSPTVTMVAAPVAASAAPLAVAAPFGSAVLEGIAPVAEVPNPIDKKWVEVKSPMVGTFYRAPNPDEPPFAAVGDRIANGQTVCIIEAMKLMNELEAEVAGQVMEILVENGQPVEFGQTLMYVNPA
jgi:acetyl-CoA carboxylase biotin carboxyl carrier protein